MITFTTRIKDLEREINELKTHGLRSSSSLALAEHAVSVTMQIVGYTVSFQNDRCAGQSAALIKLTPQDGKSIRKVPIGGQIGYEFQIISGSPTDLSTIQGGSSIPPITFDIKIYATSEFTPTLTYRQDH